MCVGKNVCNSEVTLLSRFEKFSARGCYLGSRKNMEIYKDDILALFTYYTKVVLFSLVDLHGKFSNSKYYKVLFRTTQPAHLITVLCITTLGFLLFPNKPATPEVSSPFLQFVYLTSFTIHFGSQIWMTFMSGLSLYFTLPRHLFGRVQKILFPKYFTLNSILSLITLATYLNRTNFEPVQLLQVACITLCFMVELIIRLYLTPPLLNLMLIKNSIEETAGTGTEIGEQNMGVLKSCPHYLKIHKTFRKVHVTIAIGNMIAIACSVVHLYYLSSRLCML